MVLASALFLAVAPLSLPPKMRSFPEIAALLGGTPGEVKCDPRIAHRMAFVAAKSISKQGLLQALDLELVADGKRNLLKDRAGTQEREWATDFRLALGRRYERTLGAAAAVSDSGRAIPVQDDTYGPFLKILADPKATPKERRKADDALLVKYGEVLARGGPRGVSVASIRAIRAFPSEIPPALLERGVYVDTLPFTALSAPALRSLHAAYPRLQGGPDSILVRRRILGGAAGPIGLSTFLGIVDPGLVVPPIWNFQVAAIPDAPTTSNAEAFIHAKKEGTFRLRLFDAAIAASRAGEAEGRAVVERYCAVVPPGSVKNAVSLSQIAEAWAAKGCDIIHELDPAMERLGSIFDGGGLRVEIDWSPQVVEDVLVFRPLMRFLSAPRRYPFEALRALEATEEKPRHPLQSPSSTAMARYVRFAGPLDRWESYNGYRGWSVDRLDLAAGSRRVQDLVPAKTLAASKEVLDALSASAPPPSESDRRRVPASEPAGVWTLRLAELPLATQIAIGDEMRADTYSGMNILAHSPAAMAHFIREGTLGVSVRDAIGGYRRSIGLRASSVPAFSSPEGEAGLSGG